MENKCKEWCHKYNLSIDMEKFTEATEVAAALSTKVLEKKDFTARDSKEAAQNCANHRKFFDAVLFYYVASVLYENEKEQDEKLRGIKECVWGMELVVCDMVATKQKCQKVVKHHTLHLMRQMTQKIQRATAVDDDQRISEQTWCEHYIDVVENLEARWKTDEQLFSQGKCVVM